MKTVYLDNAATTPLDPEVIKVMNEANSVYIGNPSSTHSMGRKSKNAIEIARRKIANSINCNPSEIVFTSGGTEADNTAIHCARYDLNITHFITSKIEHKAVVKTIEELAANKCDKTIVSLVRLNSEGSVDLNHLEELLANSQAKTMVCLMHGNNEIGNLLDLNKTSELCRKYNSYFMSDSVQTMGHYSFDMNNLDIDFLTCSAHKLHGPKGIGFLYVNKNVGLRRMITGGGQERERRAGTEPVSQILGLQTAFTIANRSITEHQKHVLTLKKCFKELLEKNIEGVRFNGLSGELDKSLYFSLNASFPFERFDDLLLMQLDLRGVCCSGGSACNSGSNKGSYVLSALGIETYGPSIRFSFSKFTTLQDLEFTLEQILSLEKTQA